MTKRIVYLDTAADILGISREAVRKRIKRGTLEASKDAAGRWMVTVPDTGGDSGYGPVLPERDAVIQLLHDQIDQLKDERDLLRELLLRREERILQLEAPKKDPEPEKLPWWRRWFGG